MVDEIGQKDVFMKTMGKEKSCFTIVLSSFADDIKLPPVIILKLKKIPQNIKFPTGVIIKSHTNGWMDENGTMVEWLEEV